MKTIKAKVHRLPTEDVNPVSVPFLLSPHGNTHKHLAGGEFRRLVKSSYKPQHLYFTTDEEIKEGDWFIWLKYNLVEQATKKDNNSECRKIIATTDPELNSNQIEPYDTSKPYGIEFPQIPQDFIKAYCEQGGIDEVLVELDCLQSAGLMIVDYSQDPPETVHRDEPECIEWKLKVDPIHNTIIIHPVETDFKLNRNKLLKLVHDVGGALTKEDSTGFDLDKWIEENL